MLSKELIFSLIFFLIISIYRWTYFYIKTKSFDYLFFRLKEDIKHLIFGFIFVFSLYWIVYKYQEATDLSNIPEQKIDEKLFLPLSESKVKEFNNLKIK